MNAQELAEVHKIAERAFQQIADDQLSSERLPIDLKIFMEALKPYQTKAHGLKCANTYWIKHLFEDHYGHYMLEEDFVKAILALSDGWIVKKIIHPTRDVDLRIFFLCLNVNSRKVDNLRKTWPLVRHSKSL